MKSKKHIGKNLAALLLLVALLLPTSFQFYHFLDGHEHITCDASGTHIHNSVTKCELCDFNLTTYNYDIAKYPNLLLTKIPVTLDTDIRFLQFHSYLVTNTQLRAPPTLS